MPMSMMVERALMRQREKMFIAGAATRPQQRTQYDPQIV